MTERTSRVLSRLLEVGFRAREGAIAPFDEELPLVTGVAWDPVGAQLALVADAPGPLDEEPWRQLLFAASGLRHHLAMDHAPAFGTPIVLAIVDADGQHGLRALVEELTTSYAIFDRVDLNLVRDTDFETQDALNTALAPLLPCCRESLGATIARPDVDRFWQALRERIGAAADDLSPIFGNHRTEAARDLAEALIGSSATDEELPSLRPAKWLELEGFRSFVQSKVEFAPVTILHGNNGSGKSSVLEALEILWSGVTQRRPNGVTAEDYQRHLPNRGEGGFTLRGLIEGHDAPVTVDSVRETPTAELPRSVLTQETITELVAGAPADRYAALLAITGLEVPDLEPRTGRLLTVAKERANQALAEAGLPPLPGANRDGLRHLVDAVATQLAPTMPRGAELAAADQALAEASDGAYVAQRWDEDERAVELVGRVDGLAMRVANELGAGDELLSLAEEAALELRSLATHRREASLGLRRLLDDATLVAAKSAPVSAEPVHGPVAPRVAVRWLTHADALPRDAAQFRDDATGISDPEWSSRLGAYADALESAAAIAPRRELSDFAKRTSTEKTSIAVTVSRERYEAAGFETPPTDLQPLLAHLAEQQSQLQEQADRLDRIASELERHPATRFVERADRVLREVCRFELARNLRRRGPIMEASEGLLRELLEGRLYPVVRELVAAMVRFEWYFEPLRITAAGRQVVIGGLATPRPDLDARMLLNSAERTVVGLGWFLALHLLQPVERRQVLVIDDPTASFDAVNRAGLVATLRAFVRLARPAQVIVATHDDAMASLLLDELSPVSGWPTAVARVRCRRNADDASEARREELSDSLGDTAEEEALLGLGGEPRLFVQ